MSNVIKRRMPGKSWRTLGAAILAAGATLTGLYSAYATTPPANTQISATASASYKDAGNNQLTAYSNPVVVTVQQVGVMSLVSGGKTLTSTVTETTIEASGGAAQTVYRAYILTNTGNGSDDFTIKVVDGGQPLGSFDKIEIYADDGLGKPIGSALCSTSGTSCATGTTKTLAANESFKYLVAYGIPSSAKTDGTWGALNATTSKYYRTGVVTVAPAGAAGLNTLGYSPTSLGGTDWINLTTGAAFTVNMALDKPAVAAAGTGTKAWNAITSGKRSTGSDNTDAANTTWATYVLSYNNVGAASGKLFIKSTVPTGMSYVTGSAVIACNGGVAMSEASNGEASNFGNCPTGLEYEYDSVNKEIKIYIPDVAVGTQGNVSFNLSINSDTSATVGKTAATTASAYFTPEGCTAGGLSNCYTNPGTLSVTATNSSVFEVTATRGVTFNVKDSTAGTPGTAPTSSAANDGVYSGFIVPGSYVKQKTFVISNTGNAPDTFDLTVAAPTGATEYAACTPGPCTATFKYPAGTTFTWYVADASGNLTLLPDTNSNNTPDTGELAAGASKTVVLYIQAPSTLTVATDHKLGAVVTATSINDAAIKDASWSIVGQVVGGYVDLTNSAAGRATADSTYGADVGPGPGSGTLPSYITTTIQAGTALAQIPLYIKNYDDTSIAFTPSASSNLTFPGTLPAGWSVAFSSTACATAVTPLTNGTITVGSGGQSQIYACVTSPVTSPTTSQSVYIKVSGARQDNVLVSDIVYTSVPVVAASAYSMAATPGAPNNVRPGQSVDFAHSITNTGQAICGANAANGHYLKIEVTKNDGSAILPASGWSYVIYFDANGNGVVDNGEATITDGKLPYTTGVYGLPVSASTKFIVRVFAPGTANQGDSLAINVKVFETSDGSTVLSSPNGCGTTTVTESANVVLSSLNVAKTQSVLSKACGDASNATLAAASYVTSTAKATPGNCIYYKVVVTNNGTDTAKEVTISDVAPNYTTLQTSSPAPTCTTGLSESVNATVDISAPPAINCGNSASTPVDLTPGAVLTLRFAVQLNSN